MYSNVHINILSTQQVAETSLAALKEENKSLTSKVGELEGTVKQLNRDLEEERERETNIGVDGLTRIEVARVLRERNEYKEKYLSLLEQIRYVQVHCTKRTLRDIHGCLCVTVYIVCTYCTRVYFKGGGGGKGGPPRNWFCPPRNLVCTSLWYNVM